MWPAKRCMFALNSVAMVVFEPIVTAPSCTPVSTSPPPAAIAATSTCPSPSPSESWKSSSGRYRLLITCPMFESVSPVSTLSSHSRFMTVIASSPGPGASITLPSLRKHTVLSSSTPSGMRSRITCSPAFLPRRAVCAAAAAGARAALVRGGRGRGVGVRREEEDAAGVASDSQRSRVYCELSTGEEASACARTGERASERARVSERARCVCGSEPGGARTLGIGVLPVRGLPSPPPSPRARAVSSLSSIARARRPARASCYRREARSPLLPLAATTALHKTDRP